MFWIMINGIILLILVSSSLLLYRNMIGFCVLTLCVVTLLYMLTCSRSFWDRFLGIYILLILILPYWLLFLFLLWSFFSSSWSLNFGVLQGSVCGFSFLLYAYSFLGDHIQFDGSNTTSMPNLYLYPGPPLPVDFTSNCLLDTSANRHLMCEASKYKLLDLSVPCLYSVLSFPHLS